jgi:hypothetical protein
VILADGFDSRDLMVEDYEIVTDVRDLDLMFFGRAPKDHARVLQQLREGRDEISAAAYRILARVAQGTISESDHVYVAAAIRHQRAYEDAARRLVRAGEPEPWLTWAGRLQEPARRRMPALAEGARN